MKEEVKRTKEDEIADKKKRFLEYYRELPIQKLAAASIAISEDTATRWRQADTDFADEIEKAGSAWAMKNVKGVRSKEWLLERIMKGHFAPRTEHTGADGKDLKPTFMVQTTEAKEQLEKLYKAADEGSNSTDH